MGSLRVDAHVRTGTVRLADPCTVEVVVANDSDDAAVVNGRLAVGYRDSQSREVFIDIVRPGSEEGLGVETQLYQRDWAAPSDYVTVAPGEAVRASFDLFEWYSVPGPGEYEFVVSYQADERLAAPPPGTVGGTHRSPKVSLHVAG